MMNDASTSTIRKEDIEFIEKAAFKAPDDELTYDKVFPYMIIGDKNARTGYYDVKSKTGAAEIKRAGANYPKLKISGSRVSYTMYDIGIEYEIEKDEIAASKMFERPLNVEAVEDCVYEVHKKINSFSYVGDVDFGITGLLELSGFTSISGTDLDTSNLNLVDEVQTCLDSIPVAYRRRPYTLVVADAEAKKFNKIGNEYRDDTWKTIIERNIPNVTIVTETSLDAGTDLAGGGTVSAGTALLVPKDKRLVRLPVVRAVQSVVDSNSVSNAYETAIKGRVEARVGPISVPFPTAVGKITGW